MKEMIALKIIMGIVPIIMSTSIEVEAQSIVHNETVNYEESDCLEYSEEEAKERISEILLEMHNSTRDENELVVLELDTELISYAKIRSKEANSLWSHTRPDGTEGVDMIPLDRWAGENLAYINTEFNFTEDECYEVAEKMYELLCKSETHYDNIIFSEFDKIGIDTYFDKLGDGRYCITSAFMFSS